MLGLRIPSAMEDRYDLARHIPADQRPVVFIGPYEHHSNEIPWRETIADVVTIPQDADGHIDLDQLRSTLKEYADRPLRIGSFSAASNVTGIVSNTVAIAEILHEHDALSFWDFAAAAPYIDIEMYPDPEHHPLAYKDAIFLSPHKFIGGPSTPGVLVARRELFAQPGAGRAGRRDGRLRQRRRTTPTCPSPSTARRAARPRSSSRCGRAWSSSSSRPSASRRSARPRSGS